MSGLLAWFRDWWRGYSDADIISARWKMRELKPGKWTEVTDKEFKAVRELAL